MIEKNEPDFLHKIGVDQECSKNMDRLSELPDDILTSIIYRLPIQEATATSILLTRWRHLHTRVLPLNFQFVSTGDILNEERESELFSDYVSRINHAIKSYKGSMHVSNALRVHMSCLGDDFEKWVEFALSRKVETVDLCIVSDSHDTHDRCYNIFSKLIAKICKQSLLCVKNLSLCSIHLDDHDVEIILLNFVLLEHLSIDSPGSGQRKLVNLRVVGHGKLTHLSISDVSTIKSIEVRDMINLVSLRFYKLYPSTFDLLLDSVPNLVHFSHDDGICRMLHNIFPKVSRIHHQLLNLKLSIFPEHIERDGLTFTNLINVKHMELNVVMHNSFTHELFPLVAACPSLEKLEIKFSWSSLPPSHAMKYVHRRLDNNLVKRKKLNYNLKRVRLSGCFGSVSELEFATCLINNAAALQELIVEACDITPEIQQEAIARASHHFQFVPLNSVHLVIM